MAPLCPMAPAADPVPTFRSPLAVRGPAPTAARRALGAAALAALVCALPVRAAAAPTVYAASGDIAPTVAAFLAALGDPNNGSAPGPLTTGRRQINWDGAGVPFDMPGDFFNATVTRGAVFSTSVASEFRVSNDGIDNELDTINPTYPAQFATFSAPRLFTPFDSNVTDTHFFLPGTDSPATVSGFGAVFTDVDLVGSTTIELFDAADKLLATVIAPPGPQGLSFVGAVFSAERVFRVRLTSGNTTIGPDDDPASGVDVAVMDDFFYGEPQPRDAEFCRNPVPTSGCRVNGQRNMPCVGTDGDDVITGTDGADVIVALGGNDTIRGGRGNDVICAGAGDDEASGDAGNDLIAGEEGNDRLRGGRGDDVLAGGPGDDEIAGGPGHDVILGQDDSDRILGERGDDEIDGGLGSDEIKGGKGADTCTDPDGATIKDCE
jgi:Ca2+-binding RTX toxin-like protein